jgi:hypothetical protein
MQHLVLLRMCGSILIRCLRSDSRYDISLEASRTHVLGTVWQLPRSGHSNHCDTAIEVEGNTYNTAFGVAGSAKSIADLTDSIQMDTFVQIVIANDRRRK